MRERMAETLLLTIELRLLLLLLLGIDSNGKTRLRRQ